MDTNVTTVYAKIERVDNRIMGIITCTPTAASVNKKQNTPVHKTLLLSTVHAYTDQNNGSAEDT